MAAEEWPDAMDCARLLGLLNKTQLKEKANISTNAVAKLSKNEPVSMETLAKICSAIDCEIGDIVEIKRVEDKS